MQEILSLISIPKILDLPLIVMGPGLLIIALFLFRALTSFFSLRIITTFTSLVMAFIIAVVLSHGGWIIADMLGVEEKPQTRTSSTES